MAATPTEGRHERAVRRRHHPAKPEAVDAIRAALTTLVAATRAEEGCLSYDLDESGAAPGTFVTLERWADQAALDAHLKAPHVAATFAAADGALAARSGSTRWRRSTPADVEM